MEEIHEKDKEQIEKPAEHEEVPKKKKKKPKNKKKKVVEEVADEVEPEQKNETTNDNHEDLLRLLSQNDNSLFEKLLTITPDFTKFDDIKVKFQEQIISMDGIINNIFLGNYDKIPDEEENYGYKGVPDEKNIDPKRKKAINELREKIDYFKEKIQKLDNFQNSGNEDLSSEDSEMINLIRTNLLDDIKRAEDFLLVIANTDSYVLKH